MKIKKAIAVRSTKRLLIALGILVSLFILLNSVVMPWYVNQRGEAVVVSVVGMTFEEAQRVLDSLGLQGLQGDIRPDRSYPVGSVINQNPLPGKRVNKGRRIYLTVSGGEKLVSVPNLRGRTLRDARFQLEREGLQLGEVEYLPSDAFPENTIIEQGISSGVKVKRDSSVPVVVSMGNISDKVPVPELIGKTMKEAERLLTQAGLKAGTITYQSRTDVLPNTIVDHFPHPGEYVFPGQGIDLVVATDKKTTDELFEN